MSSFSGEIANRTSPRSHALELVLDHEAKRYINGVARGQVRELLRADHGLPPRAGRTARSTLATMAMSLSTGLFYAVSALYFTRTLGLSATTVGLGLTVAGAVGVVASYAGGWASDRVRRRPAPALGDGGQGLALLAYVLRRRRARVRRWSPASRSALQASQAARPGRPCIARWFTGPERVAIRARLRVVTNVFIGAGHRARRRGAGGRHRRGVPGDDGRRRGARAARHVAAVRPAAGGCRAGRRAWTAAAAPRPDPGRSPLRDRTYVTRSRCQRGARDPLRRDQPSGSRCGSPATPRRRRW